MVEKFVIVILTLFFIVHFVMYIMACQQMNKTIATCERVHKKWIAQRVKGKREA